MTLKSLLICKIRDFGSGHPDSYRDLQPRQLYLSPVPIAIGMPKLSHGVLPAGTVFWLKYRDSARCLRRVTQPHFIAGPLCVIPLVTQFKSQASSDEYHDYFQINSNIKIVSDKFDLNLSLVRIS